MKKLGTDPFVDAPQSKRSSAWILITSVLIIYLLAPMMAGLFREVDRRGPKIFWIRHHALLCTLAHEFVYGEKPRPYLEERSWFYGLKGKPYIRLDIYRATVEFEKQVGEAAFVAFRQSVWGDGEGRFPLAIARSEWPQSFAATNGVLRVRTERYGIYVALKRGPDYEAGIFLLGNESAKTTVEDDPTYSCGVFCKSGVYHYLRERKKQDTAATD